MCVRARVHSPAHTTTRFFLSLSIFKCFNQYFLIIGIYKLPINKPNSIELYKDKNALLLRASLHSLGLCKHLGTVGCLVTKLSLFFI